MKGDLFIRDLWTQVTDSIHNMHVVNTNTPSYQSKPPKNCMKEKMINYLDTCLKQRWHFTPFVASVDGLLRVQSEASLNRITRQLAMY